MKIVKINKLKNIGILNEDVYKREFTLYKENSQNGTKSYISKILIRGDNGTGKSTFSNIFRSVEEPEKTKDIIEKIKSIGCTKNVEIEFELDDGNILQYDDIQKKWNNIDNVCIRVFNENYIKENLNLNEFSQNKIDGKFETKEVEISVEKKEYEESNKKITSIEEERKKNDEQIKNKIKETNSKIKIELDQYCLLDTIITTYKEKIDEKAYNENKKELEKYIKNFKKLKNADNFKNLKLNNFVNNINIEELNELLQYSEETSKISFLDQLLKMSVERKVWMDRGLLLIEEDKCPFCKNDISKNDFVNEYKKYSSSIAKKVENNLLKYRSEIEKYSENILNDIQMSILKNKEYSEIAKVEEEFSLDEINKYKECLQELIEVLKEKLGDVSKKITSDKLNIFNEKIGVIQTIIDKSNKVDKDAECINSVMNDARRNLTDVRRKIRQLYRNILEYSMRDLLVNRKKLLQQLNEEIIINKEKQKIYQKKLKDADLTITEMNTWLNFFGMGKYAVDEHFNLIYKETNISNKTFILSTGEISALAFSYFLSSLITGLTHEEKEKLIVIIDDPVNSLDYNKIYSFATAVKTIQSKINERNNPQLIIFTHNMLFFNILVQTNWMKNKNAKVFELYKDEEESKIRNTKNYKDSLFIVQLSEIIKCANQDVNDIDIEKAHIYNDIRSVVENLCYLLNPKYVDSDDKYTVLKGLFDIDNTDYMKLDYIVNHNSHNEPMLNIEKVFEPGILHDACNVIADMIKDKFEQLYNYCLNYNIGI